MKFCYLYKMFKDSPSMKRLSFLLCICAFFGMSLLSCERETILIVTQNALSFGEEGGSVSFPFIANKTWIAASDQSWCRVSPTGGDASAESNVALTITCDANTSFDERTCTVTITCMDLSQSIQVTQGKKDGLIVSQTSFDLTNDAQIVSIEVKANVDFTYTIDGACSQWVKAVGTKGLSSHIVLFEIAGNEEYDEREGKITFAQTNGLLSGVVTLRQGQRNGLFVLTPEYAVSNEQQVLTVEVKSNVAFEAVSGSEWIKVVETKGLKTSQITLEVAANETNSQREGRVTVKQTNGDLTGTILVRQSPKQSEPILSAEPQFNEGVELLCLVWRLMGAEEFNMCNVPKVYQSADSFFASMKNHEAVALAADYYRSGVSYDAVTAYGVHLVISDQGEITFDSNYVKGSDTSFDRWTNRQKEKMLPALNDFYQQSHFHEWYESLESLRQEAIRSFERSNDVDFSWYNRFFGPQDNLSARVLLSFLIGPNNHGHSVVLTDGTKLLTPVMGCFRESSSGKPYYSDDGTTLIHEFCHPYCNPLIAKYWNSIQGKVDWVYNLVAGQMSSMAYSNGQSMMNETFVRASVVRYFMTHAGTDPEQIMQREENRGFMLIRTVVDALGKREELQDEYATMDDFMPELVKAINDFGNYSGSGQYDEYTCSSTPNLLPGVFSVSATKKVRFTKGNLYWNGSDWRFESNQMNYPSKWDPNHVGHFYWTQTAEAAYAVSYKETGTSPADHFFCDGSDDAHLLTVEGISGLRVLADDDDKGELGYLLYYRPNADKLYKFPVDVKDVGWCIVLAPDSYTGTIESSYDATTWAAAEAEGMVCFSPAGIRDSGGVFNCNGFEGAYWSGTPNPNTNRHAYMLMFDMSVSHYPAYSSRQMGFSLRLVQEVQ